MREELGSRRSSPATASPRRPARSACAATTTRPRSSPRPSASRCPAWRCESSTTTAPTCRRRARRVPRPWLQRHAGLLQQPRGDRRRRSSRRMAAHRRHRLRRRRRQPAHHRPQEGHVHRRRVQRLPGRDREHDARRTRTSPRWPSWASPTSGWARSAWPSSSPGPGTASTPTRSSTGAGSAWPTSRCRGTSRWCAEFPVNPSGKVMKFMLRDQAAGRG